METTKNTPRDFFLYLFATVALYVSAVNVIALLWQYVNYFFPYYTNAYGMYYGDGIPSSMRIAVATLIILFPAYVWVMRFLSRDIDAHPEKRELWIRRWLTYLTLFIAAAAMIVDLVMLVYNFLGGDFTTRFALKALAVLLVAAAVFSYYLFNLRRRPGEAKAQRNWIALVALIAVVALVVGAFFIFGSPETNRLRGQDQQRISDLQGIQWQIVYYWQNKQKLPASLSDLADPISGFVVPIDPVTKEAYEYALTGARAFDLCATFALKSIGAQPSETKPMPVGGEYETPTYWQHEAGRTCFSRTIDPELYPPTVKPVR